MQFLTNDKHRMFILTAVTTLVKKFVQPIKPPGILDIWFLFHYFIVRIKFNACMYDEISY